MIRVLAILIPALPLASALFLAVFGHKLGEKSHWPAVLACFVAWLAACGLLYKVGETPHPETVTIYEWMAIPDSLPQHEGDPKPFLVSVALRADSLSATMLCMVTFVATLVALYASGYMHGDPGYPRFFTYVSMFVFSMLMLVLSANFVLLFVFWEAVGLCSYLLIGFWYEKPAAAAAGMKAFVVNRIGDFGFAIGIFLLLATFGSANYDHILDPFQVAKIVNEAASHNEWNPLPLICLCLFAGAMGKSAQFPLHVWLPDAMEGPTPVSALIHAATMVTAGVYMVARCTPLFNAAPEVQLLVSCVGGFTALLAGLIALTQTDLKRVLAYSTVSQLGYMFLGLGTGLVAGVSGAMFHLVTHAFFKALLFLGAGSVMHAMGGVIDMREFSGLRKVMPQTYKTFLVGSLALAGLCPLAGFWSKDSILAAVRAAASGHVPHGDHDDHGDAKKHASLSAPTSTSHLGAAGEAGAPGEPAGTASPASHGDHSHKQAEGPRREVRLWGIPATSIYTVLFGMAMCTAFLTAFYTFRAFLMTFHGPERIPHEAGHHAHESPPVMCVPLWILSLGAIGLGLALGHPTGLFDHFLEATIPGAGTHHDTDWVVVIGSTVVCVAGIALAWVMYGSPNEMPARVASLCGPFTRLSLHKFYLDELYFMLIVVPLRGIAQLSRFVDWLLIDGLLVGGTGWLPKQVGRLPQPIQNGLVQFYALSMLAALAVLMGALLWKQG